MIPAPEHQAGAVCAAADCTRPPAGGSLLCAVDTDRLGQWLAKIGTEYELLSAAPSMQGRELGSIGGGSLASQRSIGREHVMVLRDPRSRERSADDPDGNDQRSVYEVLHAYAETVREGRDLVRPVRHVDPCRFPCMHRACLTGVGHAVPVALTVSTERRLLADHFDWIIGQDFAGDFYDELRVLWAALRYANEHAVNGLEPRRTQRRKHRLTTPCPSCQVRALTHRPGAATVTCENCGHTQAVPELEASA